VFDDDAMPRQKVGGARLGGAAASSAHHMPSLPFYHFRRCPFLQNHASLRCICHAAFIMTATDDTPMLVESPLQPASDPEWDLHFAVRPLPLQPRLQSTPLPPNFSLIALCVPGSVCAACIGQRRPRPAGARARTL